MTAASFVAYLNNRKVLFIAIIVFIIPFIIFSFWNFPSGDDYMIINAKSKLGFWQLQRSVYYSWTGRYFATFISSLFSYSGFLYSHYYLHALLLLLLTGLGWLFCLRQVNVYLLHRKLAASSVILLSLLLLILEINIIPEPVTAFYWFSSAVTYQVPLIILILLAGILIKLLFTPTNKILYFIIATLLVIMLNGCNEIITLFALINSTILLGYYKATNTKIPFLIIFLYLINILTACFLLFSPGILHRSDKISEGYFISTIGISLIKFVVLNWFFLKEPLWWFFLLFAILFCSYSRHNCLQLYKHLKRPSITLLLLLYITSGLFIYIPVLYITNGSLPLRAENIISFLYSLLLIYIIAASLLPKINSPSFSIPYTYKYLLLSILIFSSSNMKKITDSLLSGYFYSMVMKERIALFENAKQRNEEELTINDYETAVNKKIQENQVVNRQIIKEIILKPPPIICFESGLYDMTFMKQFYGIKKLNISKR